MPRVQELVERSVATEEGDAEAFQAPLASVSYKEWEEPTTSVSGCKHGPRRLTEGAEEWYNPVENSGIATAAPYNWWIVENKQHRFAEQIEIFYGIYEEDGYWCRMPVFEDRIHRPPPGYVGVYTRQLQFGLRFPLHPFVTQLLNGYNISLCQLTPASIRRVMTFLWVALFYAFDPNIHVFRKLHDLLPDNQSDNRHGPGWWRIESRKWFLTSWPNDSSDEDWRGQWIWVRAPSEELHKNYFGAPRNLRRPDNNMSAVGPDDMSAEDMQLLKLFGKKDTGRRGREQNIPATWLPCYHYIFQEKILAAVGLSRKYRDVLHETNCGLNYRRLGINAERRVTRSGPLVIPQSERAPSLCISKLDIVEPEEYSKQKPWYLKRDPYFPLGPEEEIAAAAAAAAAGDAVVRTEIFAVNSEAGNEIGSEEKELFTALIDDMGRKRKGRAVVRPGQFPLEESSPSPKRTRLNEGSSRKKTPDSFPVQNQETPNPFSIQNREEEVQQNLREHFVKHIQKQTDAFITRVENNNVLNLKEGSDSLEEDEKCVQVPHQEDIPSASAIESFRAFRSNEMGFDFAPLVAVPGAVRNSFIESRNSAVEFFGDFTGLSELERAKIWSTRAAAGASEPFIKVPDPVAENFKLLMQAVQNHVITAGLNEELKSKAETSEHLAQMAELKKKCAEESFLESQSELKQITEIFRNFYQELEQFFFPQIEQGEELIRSYGAKDIPGLKARIQERFQQEVSAKERLAKELNDKVTLIKEEANKKESDLKEEIKRLNDLISTKDLSLVEAQNQLKAEKDSATKYRADLESARQQLKTQIYTQEQYDEGYENGFKIARRLAIHLEPNINWDEAEKWSMNIDHPKMQHPHPNELALLDRLAKHEALEENDDSEDEDGPQADKVAKSASSAAAKIPTAPNADVVNAET